MFQGRGRGWILSLVLLAVAGRPVRDAFAEDAAPGAAAPVPEEGAALVVGSDGMLVVDLLSAVSKASGQAILWNADDKAVAQRRLRGPARIPVKSGDFLDALRSVLATQEVVLVPMGPDGARYYYAMDARMLASQFILRAKPSWILVSDANVADLEGRDGWYVSTVIPVENLENLRDARAALQRIVTSNNVGSVQEVPAARAFVVTDFAPNVAAIWRLVKQLDVPTRTPGLRIESFRLAHAKAATVKALIDGLYPSRAPMPVAQPGVEPALGGPYVTADEPTNQVFVRAGAPDLAAIRTVIESVDVAPAK